MGCLFEVDLCKVGAVEPRKKQFLRAQAQLCLCKDSVYRGKRGHNSSFYWLCCRRRKEGRLAVWLWSNCGGQHMFLKPRGRLVINRLHFAR